MLLFFIGEYGHMMVASGLMATFFFGGYNIPWTTTDQVFQWASGVTGSANWGSALTSLVHFVAFFAKLSVFLWIFIWVRWTLPRFRYDQLMDLGWKTMLPWALGNTIVSALIIFAVSQTW